MERYEILKAIKLKPAGTIYRPGIIVYLPINEATERILTKKGALRRVQTAEVPELEMLVQELEPEPEIELPAQKSRRKKVEVLEEHGADDRGDQRQESEDRAEQPEHFWIEQ